MSYFKHRNYQAESTVNSATQTTTNSGIVVNGLLFNYTPLENANKVVFEYSFYAEKNNGIPFLYTEVETSDDGESWSGTGEKYKFYGGSGSFNNFYVHYRVLCKLAPWSGSKSIRVVASEHNYSSSTNVSILHYAADLSEYINTNYLIYSE